MLEHLVHTTHDHSVQPEFRYEITAPDGWSQYLWLLVGSWKTNTVQVYEGVIVPVLWSRQDEEPIVVTEILTRKLGSEQHDVDNTYELFLDDALESGKDIGMVVTGSFGEEHIKLLNEYITDHLYEVYEQFLFRPWIAECVTHLKNFVADGQSGIIATMHIPGFGPISGVSQKTETNLSGVLIYT